MTENSDPDADASTDDPDVVVAEHTHPAPDGTTLAVRSFRPPGAGGDDPVPALLVRTPYGRPEEPPGQTAPSALAAGYAVVYEDTRGRGESGGEFLPWVHEAGDGAATVEWLADRPWCTGDVGTYGGSSPGHVQLLAAAERPRGLRAIAPIFTPSDAHRADFFQDGAMAALTFLTWSLDDSVAGHTVDRLERRGRIDAATADACREALEGALADLPDLAARRPLADLPAEVLDGVAVDAGDVVPHWEAWLSRPEYDDFWRSFDVEVLYDRIDVPAFHATGWYELCQSGTLANYAGLRGRGAAAQHLVVGPWTHQNGGHELGDLDFGEAASMAGYGLMDVQFDFLATYVGSDPRGSFAVDGAPAGPGAGHVETFRTTVDDGGGGTWVAHDRWPPADSTPERWYLHSDGDAASAGGRLSRTPPGRDEPPDTYTHDPADPVPTRGGPLCCGESAPGGGPVDQRPVEDRADVLTYATPAFDAPVDLAGPVELHLTAATTAPDTDFTAELVHVTGDGAYNLCEGVRRARFRHGRDRAVPVPDGPMRLTVDLWAVHHRVPAGDRLRLEVASSNHPRFDPHPGTTDPWRATADEARPADQTVFHAPDRASYLRLSRR